MKRKRIRTPETLWTKPPCGKAIRALVEGFRPAPATTLADKPAERTQDAPQPARVRAQNEVSE